MIGSFWCFMYWDDKKSTNNYFAFSKIRMITENYYQSTVYIFEVYVIPMRIQEVHYINVLNGIVKL